MQDGDNKVSELLYLILLTVVCIGAGWSLANIFDLPQVDSIIVVLVAGHLLSWIVNTTKKR